MSLSEQVLCLILPIFKTHDTAKKATTKNMKAIATIRVNLCIDKKIDVLFEEEMKK